MLRALMTELETGGMGPDRLTVIVATGLHRAVTPDEARDITGGLPLTVLNHDATDPNQLTEIGTTAGGARISVNRTVAEADLRILTGDIELHQFVGYGGGAKSVMPGIADADSVHHTHSQMTAAGTAPGRLEGNPVRAEVEEVADMLGVDFILNVVLNSRHEIVQAFAGDVHQAFLAGTKRVDQIYKVPVPQRYDVVLASPGGYPKDIELYQSQKAVTSARRIVKQGGKIIVFAECREGHGSELAYEWACEAGSPEAVVERFEKKFVMGGHKAYQLAREVLWADVYLYSSLSEQTVEAFFMQPLAAPEDVAGLIGPGDTVAVLPQATLTLPVLS